MIWNARFFMFCSINHRFIGGYISTYVAFVPFLAWFIIYATLVRGCIIVGIVLLLVILDIFVFRHLYRKVGQLLEANKELRRLEDMIQNN